jgi:hypothetical protein
MRNFSDEQGRTRVFVEAYRWYSADGNPRRTPLIGKRAIYGWKLSIGYHIRAHSAIIKPNGIIIPFWVCDLG